MSQVPSVVLTGHTSDVNCVDFSHSGLLVSCSNDKTLRLWRSTDESSNDDDGNLNGSSGGCSLNFRENISGQPVSPFNGHKYGVNCVKFSPFDTIIASGSTDGAIILWNAQTGQQVVKLSHPSGGAIRVCCFSPSCAVLASGGDDEVVCLWDISTRTLIRSLVGHESMVTACAFTPDSNFLVSGSSAGDLKIWDARHGHGKCLVTLAEAHDLGVLGVDFSSHYQVDSATISMQSYYLLASCGNDDKVKLWHVKSGIQVTITLFHVLEGHTGNVNCCRFSPDGTLIASAAGDKNVIIWSPTTGQLIAKLEGHTRYVTCCAFSFDGSILATGSNDKTIMLWSLDHLTPTIIDRRISISREAGSILNQGDLLDFNSAANGPIDVSLNNCATVATWSVDDVISWLKNLGLTQYENIFQEHQIDGSELLHLTHDSLLTVLKIDTLGHRNKILRAVQGLRNPLWQHISLVNEENISLPQELLCPITHEFMREPVVASDGYSYEKEAISKWISNGNDTSPMTNEVMHDLTLRPNKTLSLLIKKYLTP